MVVDLVAVVQLSQIHPGVFAAGRHLGGFVWSQSWEKVFGIVMKAMLALK